MKTSAQKTKVAPIDAAFSELSTDRDNKSFGDYWVISDGYRVTIAKQKSGEPATESITLPIETARKIVEFLTTPQPVKRTVSTSPAHSGRAIK